MKPLKMISNVADANSIAEKEKQNAAASSVIAAVFLTLLKLIIGVLTGSLGILSEAAHSGLDLVAALVTFFAVRFSTQPPDADHPYGHGKIENLSALVETLLLLATCVWIVYEVIQRLFFKPVEVEANAWAFLVMITSIVVDISRSRILYKAARKYDSQALEADALHFSTDIWSSLTVIFGLTLVWLSERLGSAWTWLAKADAVAAFVVALIVIYVSLQLGRRAVAALLDSAPPGLTERIVIETRRVPGVETIGPVRVRQSGSATFVDLTVGVDRSTSLEKAHQVAEVVESRVAALTRRGDVVVHVDPVQQDDESLPQTVSAIADRLGLQAHDIRAHEVKGVFFVNLHVEAAADMTLAQVHDHVDRLEAALYKELPHVKEINTHIEPLTTAAIPKAVQGDQVPEHLREQILALAEGVPRLRNCHNLHIWPGRDGYQVVLHCLADPDLSVAEVHRLADQVERQLKAQVPGVGQVLVHVEPDSNS
jgi:cation diffusion facilitator family transporter